MAVVAWSLLAALPARAQLGTCDGITGTIHSDDGCPGQPGRLDTLGFQALPGGGATFTIDSADVHRHMTFVLGASGTTATRGLVTDVGGASHRLVDSQAQLDLLFSLGLFETLELGVAVPFVTGEVSPDPNAAPPAPLERRGGLGDLRLYLKVPLVRGAFALAARGVVTLPSRAWTSGHEVDFLGGRNWTATPSVVATWRLGRLTLAGDLGVRFRRRAVLGFDQGITLEQDDELVVAVGARYDLTEVWSLIAESTLRAGIFGRTGFGGQAIPSAELPLDANLGARAHVSAGLTAEAGLGVGLVQGAGAPAGRLFLAVRYQSERERCAAGPEDYDGFQDGDFCADPDNDRDGAPDEVDACPNDAEDRDDFADEDGCPDADDDGDGLADARDACRLETEDLDGFRDEDGCPEPDNDEDGVPDGTDRECPNDPEDRDGFQDDDGCPEPGPQQSTVSLSETRILVSERIYFDFDRDTIRPVSMPLLDQVAAVIQDIPRGRRIRVEGYSDDRGLEDYNVDLSFRRARAVVEYLVAHGVPRARLDYVGNGSARPVAPNDSPEGQALNRRVEFIILDPAVAQPGAGDGERPRRSRRTR